MRPTHLRPLRAHHRIQSTAASQKSSYYIVSVTAGPGDVTFNLEFNLADNPTASFETEVEAAAKILSADLHDAITVNLVIGYGEVHGQPLTNGEAAAGPATGQLVSYSTVVTDLIANAAPGDPNFNALPAGSSISGQTQVMVWNAELKVFGLLPASASGVDGYVGFATDISHPRWSALRYTK